jgi:hypothetical protein
MKPGHDSTFLNMTDFIVLSAGMVAIQTLFRGAMGDTIKRATTARNAFAHDI